MAIRGRAGRARYSAPVGKVVRPGAHRAGAAVCDRISVQRASRDAFNADEGWSRDVSEDIAGEVLERAFDADDTLGEDTKRFIHRHMGPGEKRPPAPSVRRETGVDQARRKTGS